MFLGSIETWTNVCVLVVQSLLAAPLLRRLGPGIVLCALPIAQLVGMKFDHTADERLPAGKPIDLDLKAVPLRDALRLITAGKNITLVMPETIQGSVTITGKAMPWQDALSAVLEAKGLWYRFRPEGAILRIAPRHELDREDEDTLERTRHHSH